MIKKKELKNLINMIDKEIKRTQNDNTHRVIPTTHLLNYCILCIGKTPHILPQMSLTRFSGETIDEDDIQIRRAVENDLLLIKAMLLGILNNYNNYKDRSKFGEFAKSVIIELSTIAIQSAVSLAKII